MTPDRFTTLLVETLLGTLFMVAGALALATLMALAKGLHVWALYLFARPEKPE